MDPLETETSRFWENFGPYNPSDPASIQTEVFQLPTTCFAEEDGSLVNSARWLQWHWKAADPPGDAQTDIWIMAGIFHRMREMYRKEGGAFPDPILNLTWNYTNPSRTRPGGTGQGNERPGAGGHQRPVRRGDAARRRSCSTALRNCATTARPNPAAGSSRAASPRRATRWPAATRPTRASRASHRTGHGPGRPTGASCTIAPAPTSPANPGIPASRSSSGTAARWVGIDVPDYGPTTKPSEGVGPFIMNDEGLGRLFAREQMVEGPFPEHYEPFESPIANVLHPKVQSNPAARVFADDRAAFGDASEFPYVATTYRLTEHFHFWTKHALINAILQPEEFIEIGEVLAKEKGIAQAGWVRVSSKRGVGGVQGHT